MGASPWLVLLAVGLYGLAHSILASLWVKARLRGTFGPSSERWYRLAYNIFAALSLLPILAMPTLLPDRELYRIPAPWLYLTLTGQALAALFLLAGLLHTGVWSFLGLRQLLQPPAVEPPRLVVRGLYRWVRHPLYTAGLLLIWLLPVMTVNLLALNLGLTLYIVIGAMFEERKLIREFGQAYVEYRRSTPMLVPFLPGKQGN